MVTNQQKLAGYVNAENVTYFHSFGVEQFKMKLENSLEIKINKYLYNTSI